MKTPREILFTRHRAAAPKLDAIRREVVRGLNNEETKKQSWAACFVATLLGFSNKLWLELVFPCRRIWTGLAAIWLLLFIINFSQRDITGGAAGNAVQPAEMIMSLQAQQRWVNELLADRLTPPDADRPRNFAPKPRSEKSETAAV